MLKDELKGLIVSQGFTMSQVNAELNRRHGTQLSFQNFSNRFPFHCDTPPCYPNG